MSMSYKTALFCNPIFAMFARYAQLIYVGAKKRFDEICVFGSRALHRFAISFFVGGFVTR
jgi:hypothetical protein